MMKLLLRKLFRKKFISKKYWETRYSQGGNSGDGSYGRLSQFKADVINGFLTENGINSAIELGCGDGNQLSMIKYNKYIGLDVSPSAIKLCADAFKNDNSKKFIVYKTGNIQDIPCSDVSLSLDVLYHIVETDIYESYLKDLFALANKYVIIYATDYDEYETDHVVHRKFTKFIRLAIPEWSLTKVIENPYKGKGEQESMANFYFYSKHLG
ncbi:MAG: class I SAM-dependent methyltransferase [Candidatus Kuenenia stuttgartiensis]|nr:class I SAM-dependent methyltransferase [Candidatus Kuenenia stuttgartiensis]